jgi:hypothetical protein
MTEQQNFNFNSSPSSPSHNSANLASSPTRTSRFTTLTSSPSCDRDTSSKCIIFASLNSRGLRSSPLKLESILHDCFLKNISVLGLQETHMVGKHLFTNCLNNLSIDSSSYTSYWDYDSLDRSSGVCLVVAAFVSKYVQKVHRYKGRYIALDIFLPAKRLRLINIYCHPDSSADARAKNKTLYSHIFA